MTIEVDASKKNQRRHRVTGHKSTTGQRSNKRQENVTDNNKRPGRFLKTKVSSPGR